MKVVLFACITLLLTPSVAFSQNDDERVDSSSGPGKRPREATTLNRSGSAFEEYQAGDSSNDEELAPGSRRRRRGDVVGHNDGALGEFQVGNSTATYRHIGLSVNSAGEIVAEEEEEVMIDLDAIIAIRRIIESGLRQGIVFSSILVNLGQSMVFSDSSDFEDECRERLARYIIEQNVYGLADLNDFRHVLGLNSVGLRRELRAAILEILDDSPIRPRVELGQFGDSLSFTGLRFDCH